MSFSCGSLRILGGGTALFCALVALGLSTSAQEPEKRPDNGPAKNASGKPAAPSVVEEPELHFRDVDGVLKPVPGIDLAQLRKLIELQNRLAQGQSQPQFTLHNVVFTGQARDDRVDLQVDLEVGTRGTQWVRVPLRLGEGALVQQPKYENERQFVHFNDRQGGYEWWVHPTGSDDKEQRHRLSLSLVAPLESASGETRLRFTAPRSNQSQMKLTVPGEQVLGTILGGRTAQDEGAGAKKAASTEFSVQALDGQFTLSWHPRAQSLLKTSKLLRSEALVKCRFDPRERTLVWDATLTVRSFGAEFDRFQVRLPPGAKLTKTDPRFVEIQPGEAGAGDLLTVVHGATAEPVTVRLEANRDCAQLRANDFVELAGFEVPTAVRQWGYLALQVEAGWHFQWDRLSRHVAEISVASAPEALRGKDVSAVFELARQGVSLRAQIYRTEPRVRVESLYTVDVHADRSQLQALLTFTVDRAQKSELTIDMADWDVEKLEPAEQIDMTRLQLAQRPLVIPLKQPTEGTVAVQLQARRKHEPAANALTIPFPAPDAHVLQQRAVIRPASNVVLLPRQEATVGLVRDSGPMVATPGAADAQALAYRMESNPAQFVADFRINPRRVGVRTLSQVTFEDDSLQVSQRLTYTVAYQPLTEIAVHIPESLLNNQTLVLEVDGQTLHGSPGDGETGPMQKTALWRFSLPPSRQLGTFDVVARFTLPRDRLPSDQSVPLSVPLLVAADRSTAETRLNVAAPQGMQVHVRGGEWKPAATADASLLADWKGSRAEGEVLLVAQLAKEPANGTTVVEKAWLRTFYSTNSREDWLSFRIFSTEEAVEVRLPPEVEGVHVALEGKELKDLRLQDGARHFRVPWNKGLPSQLLEIRYQVRDRLRTALTRQSIAVAWPLAKVVQRVWWQVSMPQDQHLLLADEAFAREYGWRWQRTHFEREPLVEAAQLDRWCGVPPSPELAAAQGVVGNRYLFSTLGDPDELDVVVVRRSWLVGGGSLVAMGLCFLWMFARPLRRPAMILPALGVAAALAIVFPDPAVVVGQAAAIGVVCGVAGLLMRRGVQPPPAARPSPSPSSIVDRSATQPMVKINVVGAPTSTAAASLSAEVRA